jgi:putative transposase
MMSLQKLEKLREERGLEIANNHSNHIRRVNNVSYQVLSQSGNGSYAVSEVNGEWTCECPDYRFRGVKCKHVFAVEFSIKLRQQVSENLVIQPLNSLSCTFCGSNQISRNGKRHNQYGTIQRYVCKTCGKRFSVNIGFEKMKASPQVITSAMQLYFTGESFRNVQKFLRLQGVKVSHVAVYKWITKYVELMEKYLEKIVPNVSDTWRADELWMKFKGDMKYVFAIMDDETRYWIAQEVAESKFKHDARKLFQLAKKVTGKKPMTMITDGLPAYHDAYKKEFYTMAKPRTEHIRHIKLKGDMNNNTMERLNGEIRQREKTMRGLKKKDTVILKGYQIFHNYIREHEGLKGKTPAEACGIKIEGQNKWKTIIQNASRDKQ